MQSLSEMNGAPGVSTLSFTLIFFWRDIGKHSGHFPQE